MELNITSLMNRKNDMKYYSASAAELGDDAGSITWQNAMDCVEESPLIHTTEEVREVRDYFSEFGAWDQTEIDAWSPQEVNALLLQCIAGDIRELASAEDRDELQEYEETQGGRIYQGDDSEWYYYIGM